MAKKQTVVADIALYGTHETGAGYIGLLLPHNQTTGDGQPVKGRSFTEAVWMAVGALNALGMPPGLVRIFEPSGQRMAVVPNTGLVPNFGSLMWEPAPQYTVAVED